MERRCEARFCTMTQQNPPCFVMLVIGQKWDAKYIHFSTNHEVYRYPNVFSPLLLYLFLGSLWFRLQGISNEFRAKSLLAFWSNSGDSSEVFLHVQILIRPQDTAICPNFSELQELATLFCCKYKLPTVRGSSFPVHR